MSTERTHIQQQLLDVFKKAAASGVPPEVVTQQAIMALLLRIADTLDTLIEAAKENPDRRN